MELFLHQSSSSESIPFRDSKFLHDAILMNQSEKKSALLA